MRCGRARDDRACQPAQSLGDVLEIVIGRGSGGVRRLDLGIHLGAVHLDAAWGLDSEAHGVPADVKNDHADVIPDDDAFPGATCQDQHSGSLPGPPRCDVADVAPPPANRRP
jgi:hypothetical protein